MWDEVTQRAPLKFDLFIHKNYKNPGQNMDNTI